MSPIQKSQLEDQNWQKIKKQQHLLETLRIQDLHVSIIYLMCILTSGNSFGIPDYSWILDLTLANSSTPTLGEGARTQRTCRCKAESPKPGLVTLWYYYIHFEQEKDRVSLAQIEISSSREHRCTEPPKGLGQCIHSKSLGEVGVISISACRFSTKQLNKLL